MPKNYSDIFSSSFLTFSHLSLHWPDGTVCFEDISGSFTSRLTGLIGDNGSGKTTLVRILAGLAEPSSGIIQRPSNIGYLPQDLGLQSAITIAEIFGISDVLDAINQLENGIYTEEIYEVIGKNWDIEERVFSELSNFYPGIIRDFESRNKNLLRTSIGELSGGEAVTVALGALLWKKPDFIILDEPTNNLDSEVK